MCVFTYSRVATRRPRAGSQTPDNASEAPSVHAIRLDAESAPRIHKACRHSQPPPWAGRSLSFAAPPR
jgi:hypothetical protein